MHLDGTKCTNNERRVLFTVSGRDSMGKQFVFLRAFIPNETAWMFKWLFGNVMPTLLGEDLLQRVRMVLTDGDSQETSQLDIAMAKFKPKAFRARCVWHVIDRGMHAHYPKYLSKQLKGIDEKERFGNLQKLLRQWMWSWSQCACETEEEFLLSKALFCNFLESIEMHKVFNPKEEHTEIARMAIGQIVKFVRRHVEPLESFLVFHRRKALLVFETNSNSAHEGTNNGMKKNAAPTNPQHGILQATDVLCGQAARKERETIVDVTMMFKSKCLHSNLPTANVLTRQGNELVYNQWLEKDNYQISGPTNNAWLCMRNNALRSRTTMSSLIPQFSRVRAVTYRPLEKQLTCSCEYFARVGIPCRHILRVLTEIKGEDYRGITADDVAVFWRKDYYFFGIDQSTDQDRVRRRQELLHQCENDISGPAVDVDLSTLPVRHDPEIERESRKKTWQRCQNYSEAECRLAFPGTTSMNVPANLRQEVVDFSGGNTVVQQYALDFTHEGFEGEDDNVNFSESECEEDGDVSAALSDSARADSGEAAGNTIDFSTRAEADATANIESTDTLTTELYPWEDWSPLFKEIVDAVQAGIDRSVKTSRLSFATVSTERFASKWGISTLALHTLADRLEVGPCDGGIDRASEPGSVGAQYASGIDVSACCCCCSCTVDIVSSAGSAHGRICKER
jgi:MULE transposase domain/SWIM zinc finger